MADRFCPRHFILLDGPCEEGMGLPCPEPEEVDPTRHVITHCGPCDKTRVLVIGAVYKGNRAGDVGNCVMQECGARVVLPVAASAREAVAMQGPITGIDQKAKPRAPKKVETGK